jgi:peptide/nickel transport system substrate-binding protein
VTERHGIVLRVGAACTAILIVVLAATFLWWEGSDENPPVGEATTASLTATESTPATDGRPLRGDGGGTSVATDSTSDGASTDGAQGMTLTIKLNPAAVWDDGTRIVSSDLECTWRAQLNTPGSVLTAGNEHIASIDTSDPDVAIVHFDVKYAAYKNLFTRIIKHDEVSTCDDISGDFQRSIPFSGRPWKHLSWGPDRATLGRNDRYWGAESIPRADSIVLLPRPDTFAQASSLLAGELSVILPQAFPGLADALDDPEIAQAQAPQMNYESLYFQQQHGPFADPIFRRAFSASIDRQLILSTIYEPLLPGASMLQCAMWVPTLGRWCDETQFVNSFAPERAQQLLTAAGWTRGPDGFWTDPQGTVPTVRWVVNVGNRRREEMQTLMIDALAEHGFRVVADNSTTDVVLDDRLPALDYDLTTIIRAASPDPSVTQLLSCDAIPSTANGFTGLNITGWCDEATSQLMVRSDAELDEDARIRLIHQIGQGLADDAVVLPLYQFSNVLAWRSAAVGGPVSADAANYRSAFNNMYLWEPIGQSTITVGSENWPTCLNPVTECSSHLWTLWTNIFPILPNVWDTTVEGFVRTPLVLEEPTVTVP